MKLNSRQLAKKYVEDEHYGWDDRTPSYFSVEDAFLAGWAARGKADLVAIETRLYLTSNLSDVGLFYTTVLYDMKDLDNENR